MVKSTPYPSKNKKQSFNPPASKKATKTMAKPASKSQEQTAKVGGLTKTNFKVTPSE